MHDVHASAAAFDVGERMNRLHTPLVEKTFGFARTQALRQKLVAPTAMKRTVEPGEVADAAGFLADPSSVSGLALTVGAMATGQTVEP